MDPKKKRKFLGKAKGSFIALSVFLAIGLLLIILVIKPLFQEVKERSEELVLVKREGAQLSKKEKDIVEIRNLFARHEKDFEKMESLFVDSENPLSFINFLEKQAAQSEIFLQISSLGLEVEKTPWPSLSFQIKMAGSFKNFLRFLERLESAPCLIQMVNLNLKMLEEGDIQKEEFKNFSVGGIQGFALVRVFTR